jgi:hypothetical protein
MTAQINMKCQPSPVISGENKRKGQPANVDILDETGASLQDETLTNIKKD